MKKPDKFLTTATMLDWQYFQILGEIGLIEGHAQDFTCPCRLSEDLGENCLAKHSLLLSKLASETAVMETDKKNGEMLFDLAEEAKDKHMKMRGFLCHQEDEPEFSDWARQWRKTKLEPVYYHKSCKLKLKDAELEDSAVTPQTKALKSLAHEITTEYPEVKGIPRDITKRADAIDKIVEDLMKRPAVTAPPPSQGGLMVLEPITKSQLWETAVRKATTGTLEDIIASLFDYDWLAKKLKCPLSKQDLSSVLSWRPLRDFLMWAVGLEKKVELCAIGMTQGIYQIVIYDAENLPQAKKRAESVPGILRVYTPYRELVYTVVLPEAQAKELAWSKQEVQSGQREKREQAAMFDKDYGRIDFITRSKKWRVIWYKGNQDIVSGDFDTKEEAAKHLQLIIGIVRQLGVSFDGVQEGIGMQFTDSETGSTTYGNTLEQVKANLERIRAKFQKARTEDMVRSEAVAGELSSVDIPVHACKTGGKPVEPQVREAIENAEEVDET